jgi:hypothetical protein
MKMCNMDLNNLWGMMPEEICALCVVKFGPCLVENTIREMKEKLLHVNCSASGCLCEKD